MKHLSPAEIETIRVPEPKHDPFTLESLAAWLERQPADGAYDWEDCDGGCLIGLYAAAHGIPWVRMIDGPLGEEPYLKLTLGGIAVRHPRTFGAALTRARAALASQNGNANG